MKKASISCRNCHFLAKQVRDRQGGFFTFSWDQEERDNLALIDPPGRWSKRCHMGVWDTGLLPLSDEELRATITKARGIDDCFFIEAQPGMLNPAAERLQERKAKIRQLRQDHRHTRIALWIAAVGLFVTACLQIVAIVSE
ncbi:MAG: hypothetical protein F4X83_12015 [Chloroflexi bacterium]|nr:hypothetical protein [Chloroflexota bacterium]